MSCIAAHTNKHGWHGLVSIHRDFLPGMNTRHSRKLQDSCTCFLEGSGEWGDAHVVDEGALEAGPVAGGMHHRRRGLLLLVDHAAAAAGGCRCCVTEEESVVSCTPTTKGRLWDRIIIAVVLYCTQTCQCRLGVPMPQSSRDEQQYPIVAAGMQQ